MGEKRFLCWRHGIYEGESCIECDGEVLRDNGISADAFEEAAKAVLALDKHDDDCTTLTLDRAVRAIRAKAKELRNE